MCHCHLCALLAHCTCTGSIITLTVYFLDRPEPHDVKLISEYSGSVVATISWQYSGDESDLQEFLVELDNQNVATLRPSDRTLSLSALPPPPKPSSPHSVKVVAVFKDTYQTERQRHFRKSKMQRLSL